MVSNNFLKFKSTFNINNCLCNISKASHELGSSLYKLRNEKVNKTYRFISERANPYLTSQYVKLHHLTGQGVNETDSKKLLEYFEHGEKSYIKFCNERFVGIISCY